MHHEEGLEVTSENRHRGCGHDRLGQTVQNTGSSNRQGVITDGGQPCMTDNPWYKDEPTNFPSELNFRPLTISNVSQSINEFI